MTAARGWLAGFPRLDAWWLGRMQPFVRPVVLLVAHCGSARSDVASYVHDPVDAADSPGAVLCHDGKHRRQVAVHASWSGDAGTGRLVQQLPLSLRGWGTGAAQWQRYRAQDVALHVELPGPPTLVRDARQVAELLRFVRAAGGYCPHLAYWCRHSDLDEGKRDPGAGLADDWAAGVLEYRPT